MYLRTAADGIQEFRGWYAVTGGRSPYDSYLSLPPEISLLRLINVPDDLKVPSAYLINFAFGDRTKSTIPTARFFTLSSRWYPSEYRRVKIHSTFKRVWWTAAPRLVYLLFVSRSHRDFIIFNSNLFFPHWMTSSSCLSHFCWRCPTLHHIFFTITRKRYSLKSCRGYKTYWFSNVTKVKMCTLRTVRTYLVPRAYLKMHHVLPTDIFHY